MTDKLHPVTEETAAQKTVAEIDARLNYFKELFKSTLPERSIKTAWLKKYTNRKPVPESELRVGDYYLIRTRDSSLQEVVIPFKLGTATNEDAYGTLVTRLRADTHDEILGAIGGNQIENISITSDGLRTFKSADITQEQDETKPDLGPFIAGHPASEKADYTIFPLTRAEAEEIRRQIVSSLPPEKRD
ncbi:hypothetical protein KBD71_01135 [Candidatus Woesebacteria bacterium]|nr:hypothetical protein [Candidatus Woesebacteria bacterium]